MVIKIQINPNKSFLLTKIWVKVVVKNLIMKTSRKNTNYKMMIMWCQWMLEIKQINRNLLKLILKFRKTEAQNNLRRNQEILINLTIKLSQRIQKLICHKKAWKSLKKKLKNQKIIVNLQNKSQLKLIVNINKKNSKKRQKMKIRQRIFTKNHQ